MTITNSTDEDIPIFMQGYVNGVAINLEVLPIGLGFYLEKKAAIAFLAMQAAAKDDGLRLIVNTAFRTKEYQQLLLRKYAIDFDKWEKGGRKGGRPFRPAKLGFSTHQSGKSVDLNRAQDDFTDNGIADGTTDQWLAKNAGRFSFCRDVSPEPWHWTYAPEKSPASVV